MTLMSRLSKHQYDYADAKVHEYVNLAGDISVFMFIYDEANYNIMNNNGMLVSMELRIQNMLATKHGREYIERYLTGFEGDETENAITQKLLTRVQNLW